MVQEFSYIIKSKTTGYLVYIKFRFIFSIVILEERTWRREKETLERIWIHKH